MAKDCELVLLSCSAIVAVVIFISSTILLAVGNVSISYVDTVNGARGLSVIFGLFCVFLIFMLKSRDAEAEGLIVDEESIAIPA